MHIRQLQCRKGIVPQCHRMVFNRLVIFPQKLVCIPDMIQAVQKIHMLPAKLCLPNLHHLPVQTQCLRLSVRLIVYNRKVVQRVRIGKALSAAALLQLRRLLVIFLRLRI